MIPTSHGSLLLISDYIFRIISEVGHSTCLSLLIILHFATCIYTFGLVYFDLLGHNTRLIEINNSSTAFTLIVAQDNVSTVFFHSFGYSCIARRIPNSLRRLTSPIHANRANSPKRSCGLDMSESGYWSSGRTQFALRSVATGMVSDLRRGNSVLQYSNWDQMSTRQE